MAFVPTNFYRAAFGTSIATLYTVLDGKKAEVHSFFFKNTNDTKVKIYVYLVPNGGSVAVGNAIFYEDEIEAGESLYLSHWFALATAGDTIQGYADASGVSCHIDGAVI